MSIATEIVTVELVVGGGCCIECSAKHEYDNMVLRIMTADDPPSADDENKFEMLLDFIEHADFPYLRSSEERYAGNKYARCRLKRNEEGNPYVSIIEPE